MSIYIMVAKGKGCDYETSVPEIKDQGFEVGQSPIPPPTPSCYFDGAKGVMYDLVIGEK